MSAKKKKTVRKINQNFNKQKSIRKPLTLMETMIKMQNQPIIETKYKPTKKNPYVLKDDDCEFYL